MQYNINMFNKYYDKDINTKFRKHPSILKDTSLKFDPSELIEQIVPQLIKYSSLIQDIFENKKQKIFILEKDGTIVVKLIEAIIFNLKLHHHKTYDEALYIINEYIEMYVYTFNLQCGMHIKSTLGFKNLKFIQEHIYIYNNSSDLFITLENIDMKFDIIIGNPPYQRETSQAYKLWVDFLYMMKKLSNSGIIAFITPSLIWTGRTDKMVELRKNFIDNVDYINFNANEYFDVGEKICWYIINFNSKKMDKIEIINKSNNIQYINRVNTPMISNDTDEIIYSIIHKVENFNQKLELIHDYSINDGRATPKYLIEKDIIRKYSDDLYNIEFIHSAAQKFYTNNNHIYGGKLKVFINFSSSYDNMFYGAGVVGKQVEAVLVNNEEEAKYFINLYTSKLFCFYIKNEKNGGFNTGILKLPKLDFNKNWTDKEIYKYFNLTQEEIDYIEKTVK